MIELFLFSWGSEVRRYTSSSHAVSWSGEQWSPHTINRGTVKVEAKIEGANVSIDLDVAGDVPSLFKTRAPYRSVGVTIYRGDESDLAATTQSIWMGEVSKVSFGPKVASMTCSPTISLGRGRLPIGRFSVGCRWKLYSPECGLTLGSWSESTSIQVVFPAQKRARVDLIPRYSAEDLVGGVYIDSNNEHHLIISAVEGSSHMDVDFDTWPFELTTASSATFAPGCNHSLSNCQKFLNEYNYGGFPAIPKKD